MKQSVQLNLSTPRLGDTSRYRFNGSEKRQQDPFSKMDKLHLGIDSCVRLSCQRVTPNEVHTPPRLENSSRRGLDTRVSKPRQLQDIGCDEARGSLHMMITGIPTILRKQDPQDASHQMKTWGPGQNPKKQRKMETFKSSEQESQLSYSQSWMSSTKKISDFLAWHHWLTTWHSWF